MCYCATYIGATFAGGMLALIPEAPCHFHAQAWLCKQALVSVLRWLLIPLGRSCEKAVLRIIFHNCAPASNAGLVYCAVT